MKQVVLLFAVLILFWHCENANESDDPDIKRDKEILILEDDGTQDSIAQILSDFGFKVELGGPYWEYTGENIERYRVIIFLNGVEWVQVMSDTVQTKIREFVQNGGTLFSTEWISWSGATNQILNDILPVIYGGSWDIGSEMYYMDKSHPITAGLPDSFQVSSDWSFSETHLRATMDNQAETIITGSRSNAAVAVGVYEKGIVIHWNMGGHYSGDEIWSSNVRMLLANIVQFGFDRATQ